MSLQFVLGASGSGKSTCLYNTITKEASENLDTNYIVLVPDQFTLETQKELVEKSATGGILNIDVLSFTRLAYRSFEQIPALKKDIIDDTGKIMLLRKIFSEKKDELEYFKKGLNKPGFLDECKSFFCELEQYATSKEDFELMQKALGKESIMAAKIRDLEKIFDAFLVKLGDAYMTAEEIIPRLCEHVSELSFLQNSVICMDGFTGFTPTQYNLIGELMRVCKKMYISVTTDSGNSRQDIFFLSNDTIRKLTKLAGEIKFPVDKPIVTGIDNCHRLSDNDELEFLEKNIFSYGYKKCKCKEKNVEIVSCKRQADEAAFVARRIFWMTKHEGYSFSDFAVVTANLSAYSETLSREFENMGIRYFVDANKTIGANVLADYVISFLEMVIKNMDKKTTFRFLRNGLSVLSREETDEFENYVFACGIRGFKRYSEPMEKEVDNIDIVNVNASRTKFMDSVSEYIKAFRGKKKTIREYTKSLYELVESNKLFEKIIEKSEEYKDAGKQILAQEYLRVYEIMINLFDELVSLLGDEVVSVKEYAEIVKTGLADSVVGFVPPENDQVVVGDVERTRLTKKKILFFIGVNDDVFPKSQNDTGILSELERKRLNEFGIELADIPSKALYKEQFYLYLTMTKPSDKLIISYANLGSDGKSKRPAYIVNRVKDLYENPFLTDDEKDKSKEKIVGTNLGRVYLVKKIADRTFYDDEIWKEIAVYHEKKNPGILKRLTDLSNADLTKKELTEFAIRELYGNGIRGSVSRYEKYVQCPYAYFAAYGLKLKKREVFEFSSIELGNALHEALEHVVFLLEKNGTELGKLDEEKLSEYAKSAIEYVSGDKRHDLFFASYTDRFMQVRLEKIMDRVLYHLSKLERSGFFRQKYAEKSFVCNDYKTSDNIPISFYGKIDRIDVAKNGGKNFVRIIDYKSSKKKLDLCSVYYGLSLQLVTYMTQAIEFLEKDNAGEKFLPAAIQYYEMKEPIVSEGSLEMLEKQSEEELEKKLSKEMRPSGKVLEDIDAIEALDSSLVFGGDEQKVYKKDHRSETVEIEVKSDGCLTERALKNMLKSDKFEVLMDYVSKKIVDISEKIAGGDIEPKPCTFSAGDGCAYCDYAGLCGVNAKNRYKHEQLLEKFSDDEVFVKIMERLEDGQD